MASGPPDLRNHKSLMDPENIEFLSDHPAEAVGILNAFLQEGVEFHDDSMVESCKRFMTLRTSVNAKRANLTAQVAMQDEALRTASESKVPQGRVP